MKVEVKCFAMLSEAEGCNYEGSTPCEIAEGHTVEDLMNTLKVDPAAVHLIFVNGRRREADTVLAEGDRVALAPAVFGM